MKKVLVMAGAVLVSALSWSQVKDVKKAQSLALSEEPDFATAKTLIAGALDNAETKDLANTWYIAGLVSSKEAETEYQKILMGMPADKRAMGEAAMKAYGYLLKADAIAMTPTLDKKGREVVDTKTRKKIADLLLASYQRADLIQYGVELNDEKDYSGAYEAFKHWLDIPELDMMKGDKMQAQMVKDTTYYEYMFYAGQFAYFSQRLDDAAAMFAMVKDQPGSNAITAAEYLYQCYVDKKDTVKANEVLEICMKQFPKERQFMLSRVQAYYGAKDYDNALALLDQAIATEPSLDCYKFKGVVLSEQGKYDEAVAAFKKGEAINNQDAELYYQYGYVYIDKGNKMNDNAAYMSDKEYAKVRKEMESVYKEALPLVKKAHTLAPDNGAYTSTLRSLYYRLGMTEEYEALQ
ncbi:MAG: tetratricopeptide repeat protein [Paludibacteraceae bacterium]|nr:tetratricopeptide repeat protein [Paludibacteraceae bacterium]